MQEQSFWRWQDFTAHRRLWKDGTSSSSEDSQVDMEEASEVETDQLESNSKSSDWRVGGEETVEAVKGWTSQRFGHPHIFVFHIECKALLRPSSQRFDPSGITEELHTHVEMCILCLQAK